MAVLSIRRKMRRKKYGSGISHAEASRLRRLAATLLQKMCATAFPTMVRPRIAYVKEPMLSGMVALVKMETRRFVASAIICKWRDVIVP